MVGDDAPKSGRKRPSFKMSRRSVAFVWAVSILAFLGVALVLGFVVSLASGEPALYERSFVWLFWLNGAVALALLVVLVGATLRLGLRWRSGKFGSRLLLKLAAIFALVGVVPGALIYTVSLQFVTRSIDAWFDTKVDHALVAGLNLGKGTLDTLSADLVEKARNVATRLGDPHAPGAALTLERMRDQIGAQDLALVAGNGQIVLAASSRPSLMPDRPSAALIRQARATGQASQVEGLEDEASPGTGVAARVRAVVQVPSSSLSLDNSERFLLAVQPLPPVVVTNAIAVQAAYRDYQQRALAREGLRRMYVGTLTLAVVLAVFGSVLIAITFGNQLARPLLLLADGMRAVAAGDLGAKPVYESRDEIGGLTRSFAQMTEQLGQARSDVDRSVTAVERARTRLQTIPGQPQRRRDPVRHAVAHRHRQPRRDAHPARAAVGVPGPQAGGHPVAGRLRAGRGAALRAAPGQSRGRRARAVAGPVRVEGGRQGPRADAAGARRLAARRRAPDGVRRHHRGGVGAALGRVERGGAPSRARDQEPAHADPAVRRTPAVQAGKQAG